MKNLKFLLFFPVLALCLASCGTKSSGERQQQGDDAFNARIAFTDSIHDFGTAPMDSVLRHTFTFRNVGDSPAVILSVSSSCACASAEYDTRPVRPGEEGKVAVTINTSLAGKGFFTKNLHIRFNAPAITSIRVKGRIE